MGLNNNDIALKVGFDIERFASELSRTNSMLGKWGGQVQGLIRNAFGIYAVQEFVRSAVTSMAQFEKSMSEVRAITQASSVEFQKLRDNALNLAGAFNAIDISKLETEFGRLGFSTQEILDATKATIDLASATGSDLARSAEIAGSTLRAFNLDAKETQRVADVVAGALNRTGLDMSSFAEAIKYVAPNAAAANISLEETAALLGILADNGIKGSMAGTTLRRIIQDLAKDSRPLIERLAELSSKGLTVTDAMDEVGRIGSTGLLILTKNVDKVAQLSTALHDVTGEAEAMSRIMQDNLIGDWQKLNAEWDKVINRKGGVVNEFGRDVLQNITNQLKVWQSDEISLFEKIFGGAGDYERFAKIVDDAQKKLQEAKDMDAGYFDTSTGEWIGGSGGDKDSPKAKVPPARELSMRQQSLAATAGRSYDMESSAIGIGTISDKIPEYTTNVLQLGDAFQKATDHLNELAKTKGWDQIRANMKVTEESQTRLSKTSAQIGGAIGFAIGSLVQGTEQFADVMQQMALTVVSALERVAIAYMIADNAKFGLVGIGLAAIGIGLVKSLFAGIGGSSGGSSGGGFSENLRAREAVGVNGTFRIDGRDLVMAYDLNKQLDRDRKGG